MKGLIVVLIIVFAVLAVAGFLIFSGDNEQDINQDLNRGVSDIGTSQNNTQTENNTQNDTSGSSANQQETTSHPQTYNVEIKSFSFQPDELNVKAGDTVIWTNRDSTRHTVTSFSGNELDSPLLSKDQSYSHTFTQTGTFSYHCSPHSNMRGTIIVE